METSNSRTLRFSTKTSYLISPKNDSSTDDDRSPPVAARSKENSDTGWRRAGGRFRGTRGMSRVNRPAFSPQSAVEIIGGVKHDGRLGRRNFHPAARCGIERRRHAGHRPLGRIPQKARIVSPRIAPGFLDPDADRRRPREIERRPPHRRDFARGHVRRARRHVAVGLQLQFVIQNSAAPCARQVEIPVMREIDQRRPIGRRRAFDAQFVLLGERIDDRSIEPYPDSPDRRPDSEG